MIGRAAQRLASREAGLLGLIIAGALGVRLLGVGRGLPYLHEWDEPAVMSHVIGMLQRGDFNPNDFGYPSVYFYMLLPVVYLHYLYLHAHGLLSSPWDIQVTQPGEGFWYLHPVSFYWWGRFLTSLVGTATVFLVYRIGKTVYGAAAGLIAAALLAVAPGAVYFSDTVRVDVPMAFFVTLTVLAGLGIVRRGRWRDYIVTGFLAGISIATKTSAFMVIAALVAAHLLNPRRSRVIDLRLVVMGLCVPLGAIIGTPYVVINPKLVIGSALYAGRMYGGTPTLGWLRQALPTYLAYFVRPSQAGDWTVVPHTGMGLLPAVAALAGVAAGFRWDRRLHLYLLTFPVLFFIYMSGQNMYPVRTMMAVFPFAALFAGAACVAAWQLLRNCVPAGQLPLARVLAGLVLVALLALPGRDAVALGRTLAQPDTRTAAIEWLQRHAAVGARIAFQDDLRWHLPALYRLPFQLYFAPPDAPRDWYVQQQIDFAVIGERSPLRPLPAVAAFPRAGYLGAEAPYPVIDPALYIIRPKTPGINAELPTAVDAGEMVIDPGTVNAPGAYTETVHLPDQRFAPGPYTLTLRGEWPRWLASMHYTLTKATATVRVGQMTLGRVTLTGAEPLRFTTPVFHIGRAETLPVQVDLAFGMRRQDQTAWALRPSASNCATVPDAPALDGRQLTLEAWVYLEGMNALPGKHAGETETEAPILSKRSPFGYDLKLVGDRNNRVHAELSVAGIFSVGVVQVPGVPFRTWTHIAATYDGRETRIYMNGVPAILDGRRPRPAAGAWVRSEGAPLLIGCRDPGAPSQAAFKGLIAGVRVWNTALSLNAIRDEAGLRPLPDTAPGLAGSWSFQPPVHGMIADASGAGNDLDAKGLKRVPIERGPLAHAMWRSGEGQATFLRTVKINPVTFPVSVSVDEMFPESAVTKAGVSSATVRLSDQAFTPGSYTLTVTGGWPRPGVSPGDRFMAKVVVDRRTVGAVTLTGTQPLRFTTPPFRIDQTQTLPIRIELTSWSEQQALHPPTNGCATAPDAPALNVQQLTIEAWVYLEDLNLPPGGLRAGEEWEAPILAKKMPLGYYLRLVSDSGHTIFADLSVAGKFSVGRGAGVPLRKWTHIAATYDGHEARIYLNGLPAPQVSGRSPRHDATIQAKGAPLIVGCRGNSPGEPRFTGLITGMRLWNRVLPPDAIRQDAGLLPLPDTTPGLAGSWSFQYLVHGTVPDLSGAGNDLEAKTLQRVPTEIGPLLRSEWPSGSPLRTVTIGRVTFPVSVNANEMFPGQTVTKTGVSSATVHLSDQAFTPGSYTLTVTGEWPRSGASPSDRLTAKVVVGTRTVGTVTLTGTQRLRFTTPPFQIDQTQTLPVHVELTSWSEQQALHPPTNGCATAPDAPSLNAQQLTVEAWVYLEDLNLPPGGLRAGEEWEAPILGKGIPLGYYLRLVGDAAHDIFADLGVAGKFSVGRARGVPLRMWTHIAATYDGHEARIYLNGLPAPQVSGRNPRHDGSLRAEGAPLVVGCRAPGTPDQLVFTGFINRARLWNRVLLPDAIRQDAGLLPLPDATSGLAGSWSFQSFVHGTIPDLSGAGNPLAADGLQPLPAEVTPPFPGAARAGQAGAPLNLLTVVTISRASP